MKQKQMIILRFYLRQHFNFARIDHSQIVLPIVHILSFINLSCLTNEEKDVIKIELGEKELLSALESLSNNKIPRGKLIKQRALLNILWGIKRSLLKSFDHAKTYNKFSTSQKQSVIKLPEKKARAKRLINNWRPSDSQKQPFTGAQKPLKWWQTLQDTLFQNLKKILGLVSFWTPLKGYF